MGKHGRCLDEAGHAAQRRTMERSALACTLADLGVIAWHKRTRWEKGLGGPG
jgi:hypothetical protein